jgi:hypothetical protein
MMVSAVVARAFPTGNPVMEMAPMGRRYILGSDAECLDRVDRFQYPFDLGPAGEPEQDFATRLHARDRRDWLSRLRGTQNVDTRDDRALLIRRPADEGKVVLPAVSGEPLSLALLRVRTLWGFCTRGPNAGGRDYKSRRYIWRSHVQLGGVIGSWCAKSAQI